LCREFAGATGAARAVEGDIAIARPYGLLVDRAAVIQRDRGDYLSSVADSWKEQTLLNVVRIRYGDAPSFLDVSSVVSSHAIQAQLSAGGVINSNLTGVAPWNTVTMGGGVAYQDRPTISDTPLAGDKSARSFLRPIPPAGIFQLIQAGYPADFEQTPALTIPVN